MWLWLWGSRSSSPQKLRCPCVWRWVGSGSPRGHWGPTAQAGWQGTAVDTAETGPHRASEAQSRAAASTRTLTPTETWEGVWTESVRSVYQYVLNLSCWSKVDANRGEQTQWHSQYNCGCHIMLLKVYTWHSKTRITQSTYTTLIMIKVIAQKLTLDNMRSSFKIHKCKWVLESSNMFRTKNYLNITIMSN